MAMYIMKGLCVIGIILNGVLMIRKNKELHSLLYQGGEGKNDHSYTRRQVSLIVRYLDTP